MFKQSRPELHEDLSALHAKHFAGNRPERSAAEKVQMVQRFFNDPASLSEEECHEALGYAFEATFAGAVN